MMRRFFSSTAVLVLLAAGEAGAGEERMPLARAVAAALADAGAGVVTHVPATGASDVFDAACDLTGRPRVYSYNEEVAYTVAHGAGIGGTRAATIVKSHGLAKAANSVIDSVTAGTTAGFVAVVLNDREGRHSDTVLDTLVLARGMRIPLVTPSPATAYQEVVRAFETSERLATPVAVLLESEDLATEVAVSRQKIQPPRVAYRRDVYRFLLCPLLAGFQEKALVARLAGTAVGGERPRLPLVPDQLPPQYRLTAARYAPVFDTFKKLKGNDVVVTGDPGTSALFALPPYDCVDITTYYGGSIPLAVGLHLAGKTSVWAVSGDYSFVAASHLGLIEAVQRGVPLKVLVFHNGVAAATGGQPIGPGVFERVLEGWQDHVRVIRRPDQPAEVTRALTAAAASARLEVVVVEVP